jgi:D-Tyr-tRNAtyr deacylase
MRLASSLLLHLHARFSETLGSAGVRVAHGVFGARVAVSLVNDGPVTIVLDD